MERKEKFVIVDLDKYPFNDISSDYYYLFDPALAARMASEKVKLAKNKFKKKKAAYYEATLRMIRTKLFDEYGYMRKDGVWTSYYDILNNQLANAKLDFKREIKKKKASIIDKNQLFGLIPLTPRNQKKRIENGKDSSKTDSNTQD
jgi:hypothetical protein